MAFGPLKNGVHEWSSDYPDASAVKAISICPIYRENWVWDVPPQPLSGKAQKESAELLSSGWGIDGREAALATCEALLDGMHTPEFDLLLSLSEGCLSTANPAEAAESFSLFAAHVATTHGQDPEETADDFGHWMRLRTHEAFARFMPPSAPSTTRAWDIMRISVVGGRAVEAGWLTTEEYMSFARRGVEQLQEAYPSWRQAMNGFLWGRAIWLADEVKDPAAELCQFSPIVASLLSDPASPWLRFPLRG